MRGSSPSRLALAGRHLASILLLPFVVTVLVPVSLLSRPGDTRWAADGALAPIVRAAGLIAFGAGIALFAWCVALFVRVGKGTLAPWDPTRALVAAGPYRHVRNPMIIGVALILAAEALYFRSWRLTAWSGTFVLVNHFYFIALEEPGLRRRFGESYRRYSAEVPRWLPRIGRWRSRSARPRR
jgi:protein-S-isoprenylcysteine O-methyltransferase Ste14